ncbi:hypothetical protein C7E13_07625, partial [Stenotrophomonas maltophilia]
LTGGGRRLRPRLYLQRRQQHETAEQEAGGGEGAHNDKFTLLSCRCRDFRQGLHCLPWIGTVVMQPCSVLRKPRFR